MVEHTVFEWKQSYRRAVESLHNLCSLLDGHCPIQPNIKVSVKKYILLDQFQLGHILVHGLSCKIISLNLYKEKYLGKCERSLMLDLCYMNLTFGFDTVFQKDPKSVCS